jgi:hypothetical protein
VSVLPLVTDFCHLPSQVSVLPLVAEGAVEPPAVSIAPLFPRVVANKKLTLLGVVVAANASAVGPPPVHYNDPLEAPVEC